MTPTEKIVTVLGAGASIRCGYPAANDLFPKLEEWGAGLDHSHSRLKKAIEYVVERAEVMGCLTPDDLALQVHQNRLGPGKGDEALRILFYSRIATDAYFLHLEQFVVPAELQRVKGLWHEILGPFSDDWLSAAPNTSHRLVTFNYDRIPEMAFLLYFSGCGRSRNSSDVYGGTELNSGIGSSTPNEVSPDRFCYLKLHGSVGIEPMGKNEMRAHFSGPFKHYSKLPQTAGDFSDDRYFEAQSRPDDLPKWKLSPLIAFPADRQRIADGGADYNFESYIGLMIQEAERAFRGATKMRIIGYSFAAPDKEWLLQLMRKASNDAEILIHNPSAKRICKELEAYDGFSNLKALDDYW